MGYSYVQKRAVIRFKVICFVYRCLDFRFSGYAVRYLKPQVTQSWKVR